MDMKAQICLKMVRTVCRGLAVPQLLLLAVMLSLGIAASAQTYVGTMTSGGYTQKAVEVRLTRLPHGEATIDMIQVKFAWMMPVHVDVTISPLKLDGENLKGDNIVPTTKGKRKEKRRVRQLAGRADADRLTFTCTMGGKLVSFTGKRKR